jgi:hypothetical protein
MLQNFLIGSVILYSLLISYTPRDFYALPLFSFSTFDVLYKKLINV